MELTKEQKTGYRQSRMIKCISEPGGQTSGKLAKMFKVDRGTIIKDVRELRKKGYPIQSSAMVTEDGMYQVLFELMGPMKVPR